jgi:hypothetical protein
MAGPALVALATLLVYRRFMTTPVMDLKIVGGNVSHRELSAAVDHRDLHLP